MQLTSSLLAFQAIAGAFTIAAPVKESNAVTSTVSTKNLSNGTMGTLALTHLYFCKNSQFSGQCVNEEFQTGECRNWINGWEDSISSIGPDRGTTCTAWVDVDCQGRSITFTNPGLYDLGAIGFNDQLSSFRCT